MSLKKILASEGLTREAARKKPPFKPVAVVVKRLDLGRGFILEEGTLIGSPKSQPVSSEQLSYFTPDGAFGYLLLGDLETDRLWWGGYLKTYKQWKKEQRSLNP